jgi:hypothetical protein
MVAAYNFSCQNKYAGQTCECYVAGHDSAAMRHCAGASAMESAIFTSEVK